MPETSERIVGTGDDVRRILRDVSFAPSCLDMGWEWEVSSTTAGQEAIGWMVRCSFRRPDRDSGETGRGFGRWWFVAAHTTESGLVKTAYAAARMNVEHELLEAFRYRGVRIFDPHHTVDELSMPTLARAR